jgi:hypothetical protein
VDLQPKEQQHFYDYFIDEQGNWFCEGNPVVDVELFRLLSRSLFEQDGRYFVVCEGEVHPVQVADAPLWVRYIHGQPDPDANLLHVDIELQDGRREPLAFETLTVVGNQAMYCRATRRNLKARFGKVAYYELTRYLQMEGDGDRFFFVIGGRRFDIRPES